MHIVFITSEFPTQGLPHGGVGTFVKFIATCLVKKGITVSVIGFYKKFAKEEAEIEDGVNVYRLKFSAWRFFRFWDHSSRINNAIALLHHRRKIDLVETPELGLAFIRKINDVKYVIRMHGGHHFFSQAENRRINPWKGFQEKRSFAKADALVGVSRFVVDHTAHYMGFNASNVPVIFNPVNFEKFYHADVGKAVRGRIVFIGTVCEKKGIRQLVMAMTIICSKVPYAHLMIAGRDWYFPDGRSYIEYLQQFIDSNVADKITFLGVMPNSELPNLIESAEICAYPSHMEAMPLAWLEGLAMGKPVVASKTGPGPEVIQHNKTGLLCDPYLPEDIADKIICLFDNYENAVQMGNYARVDVLNRFNLENILNQNVNFYHSVCSS